MAFVHEQSCECTKSELDLFSVTPTQTSIKQSSLIECHKTSSLADGLPIEFDVNANGEDYIDFANTLLYVRAKRTTMDNANLAADAAVGQSVSTQHVFSSGHFAEWYSNNLVDKYLPLSSRAGNC